MARKAALSSQLVEQVKRQQAQPDQDRVERGRIMPFGGEVNVFWPVGLAFLWKAQLVQIEPTDDIEAAEAGAEVTGAGTRDHVQRVEAAQIGKDRRLGWRVDIEREHAQELAARDVAAGRVLGWKGMFREF